MSPSLVLPPRLHPGDTVALVSPASLPAGRAALQRLGFRVRLGRAASRRTGYLAGPDADRARDLSDALRDPQARGIFCSRGGYGVSRLLEHFDPALARAHPKVVVGYSDVTLLHLAWQRAGVVSFWGPMPATTAGIGIRSARWLKAAVMSTRPLGRIPVGRGETYRPGRARGRLTGGTLSLLAASLGTSYEIRTESRLVFLEEIGEEPYRVDRLLTQLLAAGKLRDAAGILLGGFRGCSPRLFPARLSFSLREVLADRLLPLRLPVFSGLAVGHGPDQVTLPYGVLAEMDGRDRSLTILQAGVT